MPIKLSDLLLRYCCQGLAVEMVHRSKICIPMATEDLLCQSRWLNRNYRKQLSRLLSPAEAQSAMLLFHTVDLNSKFVNLTAIFRCPLSHCPVLCTNHHVRLLVCLTYFGDHRYIFFLALVGCFPRTESGWNCCVTKAFIVTVKNVLLEWV